MNLKECNKLTILYWHRPFDIPSMADVLYWSIFSKILLGAKICTNAHSISWNPW